MNRSRSKGKNKIAIKINETVKAILVWVKLDKPHSNGPVLSP